MDSPAASGRIQPFARRGLSFDFPSGIYPNLLSRLRGAPLRALSAAEGLEPSAWSVKPGGKWSALENLGHLLELEALWQLRVTEFLEGQPELTARNMKQQGSAENVYNSYAWAELAGQYTAARAGLLERLDQLGPEHYELRALHPLLRRELRLVDAVYFMVEHDDHHLALIWDLLHRGSGIAS